ncbi:nucleolar protein 56-like [Tigriopus californicus]|uniref:nucleolar protein 56-like n=1 Tax=Tigriopus californicus TaxID=6832 RepID=UPI0027DAA843|nr:nucleolar protein 56-like [Tigriopus californicus]|eukprot:TCALIF_13230-PA protein Name:"Similar to NOP56 Nucleolar protein 56 (Homo sapiens)" AED:0.04 eAED:0.04 QI:46/1/1/1/1/1/3/104/530
MSGCPSHVLFEHASGYALFTVKEFEEIASLTAEVTRALSDVSAFNGILNLVAFYPFKSAAEALANINAISEGMASEELKIFLQANLPKKLKKVLLGMQEPKLGAFLAEELDGLKVTHVGGSAEILRGVRFHFAKLVKGLTNEASSKAQLGLGHSYSRAKVKFNVHKSDNMIIQAIALLDQLDKDVNTFAMRIREWYSYHFPELIKIVPENLLFARCVKVIKNRKELPDNILQALEEIVMDSAKAKAIVDASKSSMGMDISPIDLLNIDLFANRVIGLADYRAELTHYLRSKMGSVAPNLATLIGDTVAARLISHAGSLTNLAKYPASTVQILGAEKALFRALKTRGNTPKYGLIFHSSFIGKAGTKNKGRISRYLANKCSIASRIDCFSENSTTIFGEKLKTQVEDRLNFYETGDLPKKNLEVMQEAMAAVAQEVSEFTVVTKKKKKKKRKAEEAGEAEAEADVEQAPPSKKKKKEEPAEAVAPETPKSEKKKKKKAKEQEAEPEPEPEAVTQTTASEKKKKKKKKNQVE